jgi:NADPH:quinone reductase
MRAVICRSYDSLDALRVEELPAVAPKPGEVVIDARFAAVNFADVLVIRNRYQASAALPFIPGSECAGIVRALGAGVTGISIGDRVTAKMFIGAFAEEVAVPASTVTTIPKGVELRTAAAFGVTYGTAYHALRSVAGLREGKTLLVLGAGGGVGLAAVEIGSLLGARVIAAASSDEKLAVCRERGAAELVNYAKEDLKERVRALTDGRGVDAVLDPVGGPVADPALRATGFRGRYVSVGFASGEIPRVPLNLLLLKGAEVAAFNYGAFAVHAPEEAARNEAELARWLREGKLRPHVSATFPLERATEALARVAERRAIGKILIEMSR